MGPEQNYSKFKIYFTILFFQIINQKNNKNKNNCK